MTAKEFLKSKGIIYEHQATGMSVYVQNAGSTINAMEKLLEEYHQAKLKLLGIGGSVGHSEQLSLCQCDKPSPDIMYGKICTECCLEIGPKA